MGIAAESLHMFTRGLVVRLQSRGKVERTEYIFVRHIRYDTVVAPCEAMSMHAFTYRRKKLIEEILMSAMSSAPKKSYVFKAKRATRYLLSSRNTSCLPKDSMRPSVNVRLTR